MPFITTLRAVLLLALLTLGISPVPAQGPARSAASPASGGASQAPKPVAVETAAVESGTVTVDARAVGTLRADETVTVRPEIPGRVLAIHFREGQGARKGEELVTIDPAEYQAQLAESTASTKLNQLNYDRASDLIKKRLVSQQEYDEALAKLQQSQARQALDQVRLAKTRLRAPFDGVLGLRRVSPGDYVQPGQEIVRLDAVDPIKLDLRIPEVYLSKLQVGLEVRVEVDALPGRSFHGQVYAIDPGVDVETRSVQLRARIPNGDGALRPGMFVRASLVLERRDKALLVPEQAIVPMGSDKFVFRVADARAALTKVELGERSEGMVEVLQGLSPRDVVVTAGQMKLRDGAPLTATPPAAQQAHQGS